MVDELASLFQRLTGAAGDPIRIIIELLLIAVALNWFAGMLEGTRGTRPLRRLLLVLLVLTLGVSILTVRLDWERLDVLYRYLVVAIAFIGLVAFQPELRRAFMRVGDVSMMRRRKPAARLVSALVKSAGYLSRNKFGALVAIQRGVDLRGWAENGTLMNAELSANLLNSIFYPNSQLHDLGTIVQGTRVLAANCQFPSVESEESDTGLGSRHLAAIGLSYETDALVLVVSEETGTISLADNGKLTRYLSLDDLEHELETRLSTGIVPKSVRQRPALSRAWFILRRILVVLPLTLVVWYLADQATQVEVNDVRVLLRPQPPADYVVNPRTVGCSITLRGPKRALSDLQAEAVDDVIPLDWPLPAPEPGALTRPTLATLQDLPPIRNRGLVVREASPEALKIEVDRLEQRDLPVRVKSDILSVSEEQANPPEVTVTLPRQAWDTLNREADRPLMVTVDVTERVLDLQAGEPHTLEDVPVDLRIGSFTATSIEPRLVNVLLRVGSERADVPREIQLDNVRIRLTFAQSFWQQYNEMNYRLVLVDPKEFITTLKVRLADRPDQAISTDDVYAYVEITDELFGRELSGARDLALEAQVILPPGVELIGPRPQVRVRLELRPRGL